MPWLHLDSLPQRTTKSALLRFVCEVGELDGSRIGKIELSGSVASIEIPAGSEARLVKQLDGAQLQGRRVRARIGGSQASGQRGEDHFTRLGRLLELESQAESRRAIERNRRLSAAEAERAGTSLVDLVVIDEDSGLGGRFILTLGKRNRSSLPWTRLGVGSPVTLSPQAASATAERGVVCERSADWLRIALGSLPDDLAEHDRWRVDLASDQIAAERQQAALARARGARGDRLAELRQVLLGERASAFGPLRDEPALNVDLNDSQRAAVDFALSARDVALIHGPPGTGKTTAVVEVIRRAVRLGQKVLVCAPSNLAVDNLFERLLDAKERVVRLGHPARVLPELRAHTLDLLVEDHADVKLARKLVKEALALFRRAGRQTRAKPEPGARRDQRQEARSLLADARRLESKAAEHILDTADILCATTTGLDSQLLGNRTFDLAVIDEACQSTEPGCWIPLLRCDRVVLAGDHCQLPPTVVSADAAAQGFGVSLFERLASQFGQQLTRRLTVQYRMHEAIAGFSSREFYEGQLVADESVRQHRLCDLPGVAALAMTESPVELIDTAGAGFDEELEPDGESRFNPREAELVESKVRDLLDCGLAADQIAVIAPYAAQVRLLRERLDVPGLEIDSVDGFQGREKEAVVVSLVRSNPAGEIGFLGDVRRMNVALTRARRKLLVVGDTATLSALEFYRRLFEYCESLGAYRTVWEEDLEA